MSYVTIIWSVVAACSLVLAVMYGAVWAMDRRQRASLAFACLSLAVVGSVVIELGMMHAQTPGAWGEWVRWSQVFILIRVAATLAFVHFYFGTGVVWFAWIIVALRVGILVAGFLVDPNFNFERIDSITRISFLGEEVTVLGSAVPSDWQWIATGSTFLLLVYVADASVRLWRRGTHEAGARCW